MSTAQPIKHVRRRSGAPPLQSIPALEWELRQRLGGGAAVRRSRLLDLLDASSTVPVVSLVAPPGYGKTVLLEQWAGRDPRRFAWLTASGADAVPAIARLASAWRGSGRPGVLVLDGAGRSGGGACLQAAIGLLDRLPAPSQVAVAGRVELPEVAGLRAQGRVVEIGAAELAMDRDEAATLLRSAGLEASDAEVAELAGRTEGWPAALYLAALSARAGGAGPGHAAELVEGDRFLADWLQSAVLSELSARQRRFLVRTSVLDRLCGPLCDALLASSGSADELESFERSSVPLVPLDRNRRWYRHHNLLRELLRAELERRESSTARELRHRAASWCARNGLPEEAIEYGMRAGDGDLVARLVGEASPRAYQHGRAGGVGRWLDWLDDHQLLGRHPAVAALGAGFHLSGGRLATAERWIDAAATKRGLGPELEGSLATLRAAICDHGVDRMRADAELAMELLPVSSRWRPAALLLLAVAQLLGGDAGGADAALAGAVEVAEDAGSTVTAATALSERAALATEMEDWAGAAALAERARAIVDGAGLGGYATSALPYAVAARVAIHRGDVARADGDLDRAERLLPALTHAIPFQAVQARLELVRARTALMDVSGAGPLLHQAEDVLRRRPGLGVLEDQAAELRAHLDAIHADIAGASSLTSAELRLLPHLATHHSFREIGEELHLSPHTVKTQAIAIYRKFGVSSRSQAIQRAADLGVLAS
jgi:LuxR family transcriptional regulator, maltose regulon positive regulatory protein